VAPQAAAAAPSRPRLIVNGVEIPLAQMRAAFPEWYRLAIKYEWRLAEERYELERRTATRRSVVDKEQGAA
jgi:hypothetical protein